MHSRIDELERQIAVVENDGVDTGKGETARGREVDTAFLSRFTESLDSVLEVHNRALVSNLLETLLSAVEEDLTGGDAKLLVSRSESLSATLASDRLDYFLITGDPVRGAVMIEAANDKRFLLTEERGVREATDFLAQRKLEIDRLIAVRKGMAERIRELFSDPDVAQILDSRHLEPGAVTTHRFQARTVLQSSSGRVVLALGADAEEELYYVNGQATKDDDLLRVLRKTVREYDPALERERRLDSLARELEEAMAVGGLDEYLAAREIRVGEAEREDGQLIRGVFHQAEEIARLNLSSLEGTVTLEDLSGGTIATLMQDRPIPAVPSGVASSGATFLLVGTNGGLADAIMLVRATPTTLAALSIPRDLYVEERKLSELHLARGPDHFAEVIGGLVGVSVDHYVTMNMRGFREVIADLGAIKVELENEILDPSMTYVSDGERRMLFFPAGEQEIGPEAVMALVRSRATTSDYNRSQRQRAVIAGVRRELAAFSAADTDRVFALLETVARNARTDLSLGQLMSYYRQFRGAIATRQHGLSEDNVLQATYSNVYQEGLGSDNYTQENGEDLGAWILLPKGDDWNLLRWYVRAWLAGRSPSVEEYLGWDSSLPEIPVAEDDAPAIDWFLPSDREETRGSDESNKIN